MDGKSLWIVVDASGSTGECGRKMLSRQICRSVEQYLRYRYGSADLHLVVATGEVAEVEWKSTDEFPIEKLPCLGTFNPSAVVQFFKGRSGRILIITDGYMGVKGADVLSDWALTLDPDSVRMIMTNPAKKFGSSSIKSFSAQEMFLAMDQWLGTETGSSADSGVDEW